MEGTPVSYFKDRVNSPGDLKDAQKESRKLRRSVPGRRIKVFYIFSV